MQRQRERPAHFSLSLRSGKERKKSKQKTHRRRRRRRIRRRRNKKEGKPNLKTNNQRNSDAMRCVFFAGTVDIALWSVCSQTFGDVSLLLLLLFTLYVSRHPLCLYSFFLGTPFSLFIFFVLFVVFVLVLKTWVVLSLVG